jgi:hypothetical protein
VQTSALMTGSDLPIACTLGAGDLETRQAELAALGRRSLISVDRPDGGPFRLSFESDPLTKAELERIVAAEAECCAFLKMTITDSDPLELTIDGPDDAGLVIEELVSVFASEAAA